MQTTVRTYTASVFCGLREGYAGPHHSVAEVEAILADYCDAVGLGATLTETRFIYKGSSEPGVVIGLINYPRAPNDPRVIREHAFEIAGRLKAVLGQLRVLVVFPEDTVMIGAH